MIKATLTCPNLPKSEAYFQRKQKETTNLVGNISTKVGLSCMQNLRMNMPQWTGEMYKEGMASRLVLFKMIGRYWITFTKTYTQFANEGRRAVVPKRAKKLRWFKSPAYQDLSNRTTANKVFATRSPPTGIYAGMNTFKSGNMVLFIPRSVQQTQRQIQGIAGMEINKWLLS